MIRDFDAPIASWLRKIAWIPASFFHSGIAVVAALISLALRMTVLVSLGDRVTYVTFYPAVMFAALRGGFKAGLLCAALSAALADYFLVEPTGSFVYGSAPDVLGMIVFLISCTGISLLAEIMHSAQRRAANAEADARLAAERARTEEALQNERQFMSAILQTVGSFVVVLDREGRIVHFNRAAEKATGHSLGEIRGRCFWELLIPPEEIEPIKAVFSELCAGQYPNEYENSWVARDGTRRLCHWTNTCLTDDSGQIQYIIGTGLDITDNRRAELERQLSESRLQLVLQSSLMGTFEVDLKSGDGRWNDVEYALLGLRPDDAQGTPETFFRHVHPEDLESLKSTWEEALKTGVLDADFRIVRADGQVRWLAGRGRIIGAGDGSGRTSHFLGVNFDITDRKQAEQELRESETKHRQLFENMAEGFALYELIYDEQGKPADWRVLQANAAYVRHTGIARERVVGKRISSVFPDSVPDYLPLFAQVVQSQQPLTFETYSRPAERHLHVVSFPTGGPFFASLFEDISARQRNQRERDLTISFLRMVNASKNLAELLQTATLFFKENTGCDAVGIRLKTDSDYPYREALGFSEEFLEAESSLCDCCHGQAPRLTSCMCGQVISGCAGFKGLSLTEHGSFWTSDTAELLRRLLEDAAKPLRGRCIHDGYGSLALLPLFQGQTRMGLLQLNARQAGLFTAEDVSAYERLADHLAIAISKFQAEDALRQSRARYQILSAATFEGIAITEGDRLVEINAQFARMLGYTRGELLGSPFDRLLPKEDRDQVRKAFETYSEKVVEHHMVRKDGAVLTVESHNKPWTISGQRARLIALRDITERKRTEEALRKSETRFRSVFDHAATGISITDYDGHYVQCNAAYCNFLGYTQEELASLTFPKLIHPEDCQSNMELIQRLLQGDIPSFEVENRYIRKDGSHVWVHKCVSLLGDDKDKPPHIVALVSDITDRKQTEEVLRFLNECDTSSSGEGFFQQLARYLAHTFNMDFVCIDRLQDDLLSASTLAVFHNGKFVDNVSYTLKDTPCGDVMGKRICCFARNVRRLFPNDAFLQDLRAESYVGATLWSAQGKPIGLIAVIGQTPLADTRRAESLLQLVAVRAAGELERQQAESEVRTNRLRAELLARTAGELLASADPQRVIESLCLDVMAFLDCHAFFNFLADSKAKQLHLNACAGISEKAASEIEWLEYGVSVCGCAALQGQRIIAQDILHTADPRTDLVKSYGIQAYCCHPLMSHDKVIGTLSFGTRSRTTFSDDDVTLMKAVADQVAIAIAQLRNREVLRESQEDLNRAQIVAHVGSWRLNVQRNELLWSDENWRLFGVQRDTPLTYETFLNSVHPEDRKYVHEKWSAALRGEPYDIEHRIVAGDAVKWVRERAELEFGPDGALLGGFGTTQDITDQKYAELVKARYELIAQYARDPLLLVDLDGHIIEANQAAMQLYGYPRNELIGQRLYVLRQDDAEVIDLQMQQALKDGVLFETTHVRKDGTTVPVEVSSRGVTISGQVMLLSVIRDIRQRKATELNLRQAKEEAEHASQAKSDFLAAMSHELRTPLNAVMGFSQVLENEYFGPLTEKQREYVHDIYESGKHLLSLINDILDLSKIEAGKMEPLWAPVDVCALLENSLTLIREKCSKHNLRLSLDVSEPLRGLQIRADERRLKQIMYNLLSNSSKFTPDGGSIRIQARLTDDPSPMLEVTVADSGIGIAPEHQRHVFEAFYQVQQGALNKTPGTGLGLCLVDQLLKIHDGQIWVESDGEGRGSRFTFVIPAVVIATAEAAAGKGPP